MLRRLIKGRAVFRLPEGVQGARMQETEPLLSKHSLNLLSSWISAIAKLTEHSGLNTLPSLHVAPCPDGIQEHHPGLAQGRDLNGEPIAEVPSADA